MIPQKVFFRCDWCTDCDKTELQKGWNSGCQPQESHGKWLRNLKMCPDLHLGSGSCYLPSQEHLKEVSITPSDASTVCLSQAPRLCTQPHMGREKEHQVMVAMMLMGYDTERKRERKRERKQALKQIDRGPGASNQETQLTQLSFEQTACGGWTHNYSCIFLGRWSENKMNTYIWHLNEIEKEVSQTKGLDWPSGICNR